MFPHQNTLKTTASNPNQGGQAFIKGTFHLGGTRYVIYQGSQGLIENIYLKEWEGGQVKNEGSRLSVPKLVVIYHYVEFIMYAVQKISDGKKRWTPVIT